MVGRPVPVGKWSVRNAYGKIVFVRVHDKGTGYGPKKDYLDAEVIIQLSKVPNRWFGFQLRQDENLAARQGMLQLILDAFRNKWTVGIAYYHWYIFSTKKYDDRKNHRLFRVWVKQAG